MVGAGRTELAFGIFGALPIASGTITVGDIEHTRCRRPRDRARDRPRYRGPQGARPRDAPRRRGQHHRADARRIHFHGLLDAPPSSRAVAREASRATASPAAGRGRTGRDHVGRQPAKGPRRPLGAHLPQRADPRRADARRRCRRQGGDLSHHARAGRCRHRHPDDQLGADRDHRHGRSGLVMREGRIAAKLSGDAIVRGSHSWHWRRGMYRPPPETLR